MKKISVCLFVLLLMTTSSYGVTTEIQDEVSKELVYIVYKDNIGNQIVLGDIDVSRSQIDGFPIIEYRGVIQYQDQHLIGSLKCNRLQVFFDSDGKNVDSFPTGTLLGVPCD